MTAPHVPAAFINAIAEEGTKEEAVNWLQKEWNENCQLRAQLAAAEARAISIVESAMYVDPLGTAENSWNGACEHILDGLRSLDGASK